MKQELEQQAWTFAK